MALGRPREFSCDKALDQALQVFWRKGYEGASMADLTAAIALQGDDFDHASVQVIAQRQQETDNKEG